MATADTAEKVSVAIRLNNGTDSDGHTKLANVNLGSLSVDGYDNDKMAAVATKLVACLSLPFDSIRKTSVSEVVVS